MGRECLGRKAVKALNLVQPGRKRKAAYLRCEVWLWPFKRDGKSQPCAKTILHRCTQQAEICFYEFGFGPSRKKQKLPALMNQVFVLPGWPRQRPWLAIVCINKLVRVLLMPAIALGMGLYLAHETVCGYRMPE